MGRSVRFLEKDVAEWLKHRKYTGRTARNYDINDLSISCGRQSDNTEEFRQERKGSYYYAVVEHKKSVMVVITAGESEK